jgi:hypothetical protein
VRSSQVLKLEVHCPVPKANLEPCAFLPDGDELGQTGFRRWVLGDPPLEVGLARGERKTCDVSVRGSEKGRKRKRGRKDGPIEALTAFWYSSPE